jgi:integrase
VKGSTFRRCACRDPATGKQYGQACPKFRQKRHGVWNLRQELPPKADGTRRTFRRGGYESAAEAQKDLDRVRALLGIPDEDDTEGRERVAELLEKVAAEKLPVPDLAETKRKLWGGIDLRSDMTVGEWLDTWLGSKKTRRTTLNGYASHVKVHLKPRIGHIRLDRLNVGHIQAMFDAIKDDNEVILAENAARKEQVARCQARRPGRPDAAERRRMARERAKLAEMKPFRKITGAASRQRIRATLRAALNAAITRRLITFNAAAHVELDSGKRPKAVLWTDEHVARWRATGEIPSPVMVWTPRQLGRFLDEAEGHRLYALFHLIAFRGLRRGEAVGLDWAYVNLDAGLLTPAKEIVQDGWTPYESDPKTDGSAAPVHLDSLSVTVVRAHRVRQAGERLACGAAWQDTGKVFTQEDGSWLHPETVSTTFRRLSEAAGLPPINLRDLRHVAATLTHAAGGDLHTIKEVLRHSTITLTSDTYTSLLPEIDREVAEKAARLVPRAGAAAADPRPGGLTPGPPAEAGDTPGLTSGSPEVAEKVVIPFRKARETTFPEVNRGVPGDPFGRPCGARTHNQWIKSSAKAMPGRARASWASPFPLVSDVRQATRSGRERAVPDRPRTRRSRGRGPLPAWPRAAQRVGCVSPAAGGGASPRRPRRSVRRRCRAGSRPGRRGLAGRG